MIDTVLVVFGCFAFVAVVLLIAAWPLSRRTRAQRRTVYRREAGARGEPVRFYEPEGRDDLCDITNPASPLSPLNPSNPASPFNLIDK